MDQQIEVSKDTGNTFQSYMLHWCCTLLTPDVILVYHGYIKIYIQKLHLLILKAQGSVQDSPQDRDRKY